MSDTKSRTAPKAAPERSESVVATHDHDIETRERRQSEDERPMQEQSKLEDQCRLMTLPHGVLLGARADRVSNRRWAEQSHRGTEVVL